MKPSKQDLESVRWPVRLWWAAEDKIPGLLPAVRRFWRWAGHIRHPRAALYYWRLWRARPPIGGQALVHGETIQTVTGYGAGDPDRLIFEDGTAASWMNCCEPVPQNDPKGR